MKSLLFLSATLALVCIPSTTAQEEDPTITTEWFTPTATLPNPYDSASLYTSTNDAGSCEAFLTVYSSNRCAVQTTYWPSTTTLTYPIDCHGCSELDLSVRRGGCPNGGHRTPMPPTSVETPRTVWDFGCASSAVRPVKTGAVEV